MKNSASVMFHDQFTKSRIALATKILAILVPVLFVYWQDLELVFRESLATDFMNYVLILPVLFGYILYRKRKTLNAMSTLSTDDQKGQMLTNEVVIALPLLAISFLTYFLGSYTSYALEYHLLSFPMFVAGTVTLVFNLETLKALLFPLALLFFIQPYLIQLVSALWADLSWISATAAYYILTFLNVPAGFTTILEIPTIEITTVSGETVPFTVGVASSGLNSFIGFTVFSIFVVYIAREVLWKRIALVLIGYPLLILLNALRIAIILGLAYQWGMATAEVFHQTGGLVLVFIGTVFLLFIGEKALNVKWFAPKPVSGCATCYQSSKNGHNFCLGCGRLLRFVNHTITRGGVLKMTSVILATILLVLVQTPPIALGKSPTQIDLTTISAEESKQLLPVIPNWNLEFLYRDVQVEKILRQDAALAFAYIKQNTSANGSYSYIFVTIQISVSQHTWESSLITYGHPPVTVLDLRDIQILENPRLAGRFFAYQRSESNLTEVVLYWFERVPFKINSVWDMRNVQISLWSTAYDLARSGLISTPDDLEGAQNVYLSVSQTIADYWQPIKTSSQISAVISQYGGQLTVATGVLSAGIITLYALQLRSRRKANAMAYKKLSTPNKLIIDILHRTEKTTTPTLDAISTEYRRATGNNVDHEELFRKLLDAEKIGLVKHGVVSKLDEPVQVWKTQFAKD